MDFNTFTFSSRSDSPSEFTGGSIARKRDDLQQVVLHDVADRARLLVELAAARPRRIFSAMVICTLATKLRFQIGSRKELAKRKYSRFCTASLPR